jgi:hypothetical protein
MRSKIGVALISLLAISGCDALVVGAGSTIDGSGVTKEEKREVAPFRGVDVSATFEATITIGPACSVTLSVDDNLAGLVRTSVRDGRLEVRYVEGPIIVTSKPQKIKIVVPDLDFIAARGAAKVFATVVEKKALKIETEGAASVEVNGLDCESVEVKANGAGHVTLEGKGKSLTLEASGASKLRAADATFESAQVAIEGASRCEVNVTGSIAGETTGASSLDVLGSPASRSVKVVGVSHVTY